MKDKKNVANMMTRRDTLLFRKKDNTFISADIAIYPKGKFNTGRGIQ